MYTIVDIAADIFDVLLIIMFFSDFLIWKSNKIFYHVLCGIVLFAGMCLSNYITDVSVMRTLLSIICFTLATMFFDGNFLKKLLVVVGFVAIVAISDLLTALLSVTFIHATPEELLNISGGERMFAIILSKPLYIFGIKLVSMFKNKKNIELYRNYWIAILTIPISDLIVLLAIINCFYSVTAENFSALCFAAVCLLYSILLVFYLFDKVIGINILQNNYKMLENQVIMQNEYSESDKDTSKKYDAIRHDLKNHFQLLYDLNKAGKNDTVGEYLTATGLVAENNKIYIKTGCFALDSVINGKLALAESKGIKAKTDCKIPADIKISPIDIGILFGNLLDNAIEGCMNCKTGEKIIKILLQYRGNRAIICVQNSADLTKIVTKGNKLISTKNTYGHGIGLSNINDIVRKYNGMMQIASEDDLFRVNITLFDV